MLLSGSLCVLRFGVRVSMCVCVSVIELAEVCVLSRLKGITPCCLFSFLKTDIIISYTQAVMLVLLYYFAISSLCVGVSTVCILLLFLCRLKSFFTVHLQDIKAAALEMVISRPELVFCKRNAFIEFSFIFMNINAELLQGNNDSKCAVRSNANVF